MKKIQHCLSVLKGKLEKAPTPLFTDKRYKEIRKNEFENKHGVYALYNKKGRLYYVGRASNMKSRLYNHLRNKHSGQWHYFSVYFTNSAQQARELESIIISIDKPKGNTQKPKLKVMDKEMKRRIKKSMKVIDKERRQFGLVGAGKKSKLNKTSNRKSKTKNQKFSLKGLFSENKPLRGEHKQNTHSADLLTSGKVLYKGKEYSLSGAGKVVRGLETNGWTFWQIRNHKNKWIALDELRKKPFKKVA